MLSYMSGKVDITPYVPVILAGYSDYRVATTIHDQLEANFLIIRGNEEVSLIISFDLLYVGGSLRSLIWEGLKLHLLKEENLFCAASHTHFAPATDSSLPYLGQVDDKYVDTIAEKIIKAVKDVLDNKHYKSLKYLFKKGGFKKIVNRRLKQRQILLPNFPYALKFKPNLKGEIVEEINIVELLRVDGTVESVLWTMSCHPVSFSMKNQVSADYPGYIRKQLRSKYRNDIPVIFLQGAAGEVRPPSFKKAKGCYAKLKNLLRGYDFGSFSMEEWKSWCHDIWIAYQNSTDVFESNCSFFRIKRCIMELAELIDSNYLKKKISFHGITIDEKIQIAAVSSELMVEHRNLLNSFSKIENNILVGCIDQVHGYWPTDQMLEDGGYEADTHRDLFSINGVFKEKPDQTFLKALKKLLVLKSE